MPDGPPISRGVGEPVLQRASGTDTVPFRAGRRYLGLLGGCMRGRAWRNGNATLLPGDVPAPTRARRCSARVRG